MFSKFSYWLAGLACLFLALALLIQTGLPKRTAQAAEAGSPAPPFSLLRPDLDSFALEQARGQVTFINFWATWCAPCRVEMQALQELHRSHSPPVRILAVNLGESPRRVTQWVEELGLSYDILLDPLQSAARLYRVRGQPSTYLLDAEHRIRHIYFGPVSLARLTQDIERISRSSAGQL